MDFQKLRKEYEDLGIDDEGLPESPMELFRIWFAVAVQNCPGEWFEPNAMSLATADQRGNVSVRIVLLKGVSETGIQFFTNYESAKGKQLAINPQAAIAFHWPYLGRQIRLEGVVIKTSREVSENYFHSRPRASQISASASRQSEPLNSREALERVAQKIEQECTGQPIPLPDYWGGFELVIRRAEFWQGRSNRLHDRIVFSTPGAGQTWTRLRLAP